MSASEALVSAEEHKTDDLVSTKDSRQLTLDWRKPSQGILCATDAMADISQSSQTDSDNPDRFLGCSSEGIEAFLGFISSDAVEDVIPKKHTVHKTSSSMPKQKESYRSSFQAAQMMRRVDTAMHDLDDRFEQLERVQITRQPRIKR